jgi:hypothetical protein
VVPIIELFLNFPKIGKNLQFSQKVALTCSYRCFTFSIFSRQIKVFQSFSKVASIIELFLNLPKIGKNLQFSQKVALTCSYRKKVDELLFSLFQFFKADKYF